MKRWLSGVVRWGGCRSLNYPATKTLRKLAAITIATPFAHGLPGGTKAGITHGATDELGFSAVEDKVSVPDWHATILHLLGLHHEELFVEKNGLRERLTGVLPARVISRILA